MNGFALDLYREAFPDGSGNVVIGPYSLATALLLTMAGTAGDTGVAFADLLGVAAVADVHDAVNALDLVLEGRAGEDVVLSTANALFVQNGLPLVDTFLDVAVGSYGAPVRTVDFADPETVAVVNRWVEAQTDGFIDRLVDGFDPETAVVVANAIYLQGAWAVDFRRLPEPMPFTTAGGETVEVAAMAHDEYLPLAVGPDHVAVELPYSGGNFGLVVIQPDDLAAFEAGLTTDRLAAITGALTESGIHLTMPVWSTSTELEALEVLESMGLPDAFDFSAMIEGGEEGFYIDAVSHVARIDVDETGTTAGAASDVVIVGSHGPTVTIDRPFLYLVRDRATGVILFIGRVADPTAG
jgi:serpin B